MADILDLPEVRARLGRLSVQAYEAMAELGVLKEDQELIRGMLVTKMPKSPLHCELIKQIFLYLLAFQRAGLLVYTERPLRLTDSMPEPDVMIVRGERKDFLVRHPTSAELVVEVAISSVAFDREKALLYAEAGVPEYWIVLADERAVEVYRQPENGVYQQKRLYVADETLICESVPGCRRRWRTGSPEQVVRRFPWHGDGSLDRLSGGSRAATWSNFSPVPRLLAHSLPMKSPPLAAACLASLLTASPLRAQEPAAAPAPTPDAKAQSEQILQNPLVQQLLRTAVQKALEMQPGATTDGSVKSSDIVSMAKTLLSNLTGMLDEDTPPAPGGTNGTETAANARPAGFTAYSEARLANEPGERRLDSATRTWVVRPWSEAARARMLAGFQQDYARLGAAERAAWESSATPAESTLVHAWDSSLGSVHVQPSGGLRTGGLSTGKLSTGQLSASHITSGSTTSAVLPPRDFVTPDASAPVPSAAIIATTAVNAPPPADPDDAMRRWSKQIDGQYASEVEARAAAVRTYPDLAVANSAFNTQFLARYTQYRQADPFGFLRGPGWPMKLAIFTDGDLKRQSSGSAERP